MQDFIKNPVSASRKIMTYALRRKRNRVFDRLENWDARFYKKPGFCVQEDHELRTPTQETGFFDRLENRDARYF